MTTLVPYRCEHANGDVKFAVRPSDIAVLEEKSYVCAIDPDEQFDEHDTAFGPIYSDVVVSIPTSTLSTVYVDPLIVLSNGNLTAASVEYDDANVIATTGASTGKKYYEVTVNAITDEFNAWSEFGMTTPDTLIPYGDYPAYDDIGWMVEIADINYDAGDLYYNSALTVGWQWYVAYGAAEVGSVIAVAVDLDLGHVWFKYIGLPWAGGGDPVTGTTPTVAYPPALLAPAASLANIQLTFNFGGSAFTGAIPSGFEAWG